jgi:hypothetical protein
MFWRTRWRSSPEFFDGQTLLVWCGEVPSASQQQLLTEWRENGYPVYSLVRMSHNGI